MSGPSTLAPAPFDPRDTGAVGAYGGEWLRESEVAAATRLLAATPLRALLRTLEDLAQALQADDPRGLRRSVGWLGRLLGRDLERAAQARALQEQLGVLLADADRHAALVRRFADELGVLQSALQHASQGLGQALAQGRQWLAAAAAAPGTGAGVDDCNAAALAWARRLAHLDALAASYAMTASQLQLTRAQAGALLDSHDKARDLLLPLWRHQVLARTALRGTGAAFAADAAQACELIRSGVARCAAAVNPPDPSAAQEPSA